MEEGQKETEDMRRDLESQQEENQSLQDELQFNVTRAEKSEQEAKSLRLRITEIEEAYNVSGFLLLSSFFSLRF